MKNYLYVVVILNYNSCVDSIKAANSVNKYSKGNNYLICIADNSSTNEDEVINIEKEKLENTIVYRMTENSGYAKGNNNAIKYLKNICTFDYIVIMNPDVSIIKESTIEEMINRLEQFDDGNFIGGQPLVWNYRYGNNAEMQMNIRKVPNYSDLIITAFFPYRLIFRKRWLDITYLNKRPYANEIVYHVPSGAFFIIKADKFFELDMFDDETFLYNEEIILGYKIQQRGYKLIFMPDYKVKHVHGKSIQSDRYSRSKNALNFEKQSRNVYLKKYLKKSNAQINYIMCLLHLDYYLRNVIGFFMEKMDGKKYKSENRI